MVHAANGMSTTSPIERRFFKGDDLAGRTSAAGWAGAFGKARSV